MLAAHSSYIACSCSLNFGISSRFSTIEPAGLDERCPVGHSSGATIIRFVCGERESAARPKDSYSLGEHRDTVHRKEDCVGADHGIDALGIEAGRRQVADDERGPIGRDEAWCSLGCDPDRRAGPVDTGQPRAGRAGEPQPGAAAAAREINQMSSRAEADGGDEVAERPPGRRTERFDLARIVVTVGACGQVPHAERARRARRPGRIRPASGSVAPRILASAGRPVLATHIRLDLTDDGGRHWRRARAPT